MGRTEPACGWWDWGDAVAGSLLGSENLQPVSGMDEINLEPSLKYLHCQEDCGGGFQRPLSPAILLQAILLPCEWLSLVTGWPLQCRGCWASRLGLAAAQASLDSGCCSQRDKTLCSESTARKVTGSG